jgi:signal transduction histidine kinase/ActR/RegA family two-component response regulator
MFLSSPELHAIPVIYDAAPLGLIVRSRFMELFARVPNVRALMQQAVARVMVNAPDLADVNAPAALIAKQLAAADPNARTDGMIVVEDGRYAGYVAAEKLFAAVAKENAMRAKVMKANLAKLDKARQESINLRREQARFLAFLGHEIRTPLTGILGVADLLGDRKLDTEARAYARTISESGQHLDRLLGDFLDLSRLEVGKLKITPAPFKVSDFAKEVRQLWSAQAGKKGVSLKVTLDNNAADRVEGDATRLRQILFNLIGNAMKFTEKGSVTAHIQTRMGSASKLTLDMTVIDTGIGIADEDKARLFEAFEQATPQTVHRYGGTGLGLSIAKGLIERMGGGITLADNPEGGTIFNVICPVLKAGPRLAVENKTKHRSANFKLGRILLVEDHGVSRFVVTEALKAVGWQVDAVNSVRQARRRAGEIAYQAILSDLHLGNETGLELVKVLRSEAGPNQWAPILAVSADVSAQRINQAINAGFSEFIQKPIRPRQLVAKLVDAIISQNPETLRANLLKAI